MEPLRFILVAILLAGIGAGCGKEITSLQRKEAAALESEAQFAVTLREYARAESLLAQATALAPDTGELWLRLGMARMKLGRRDEAKAAYDRALRVFRMDVRKMRDRPEVGLQAVTTLALLGQPDAARKIAETLAREHPDNRPIRAFMEEKRLEQMLTDPQFKELAL